MKVNPRPNYWTLFLVVLLAAAVAAPVAPARASEDTRIDQLETTLDRIRQELKIPAMSAAIVKDQRVVWAKGFGFADPEKKVPATEHTSYHLASLTKTFASTIVMQLVEEGKVKLDDPVSKYGVQLESEGVIRVKHLLSHTSEGNPGERYSYNGNRYAELDKVIQKATGKSFAELLIANILDPLDLKETGPNVPVVVKTSVLAGPDQKSAEEVKAALTAFIGAFNSGNVDQIERTLAPRHNSFRNNGGLLTIFADPAELRGFFRSGSKIDLQALDLEAAVFGDTALTTFIMTSTVTPSGGRPFAEGPWRASFIWNRRDGAWKLVHTHQSAFTAAMITDKQQQRFDAVMKNIAEPYGLDNKFEPVKIKYPTHFSTSAGLISSVLDMAKYDIAIDQNRFLKKETQQLAFTPMVSTKGETLPYGLGWFTQNYKGTRLIWHYGYWTANSSLILKVPDRNITFIAMANTDNLSRPTDLGGGDVTSSPVGLAFLKTFIFPEIFKEAPPEIDWKAPADALASQLKGVARKPYSDLYIKELLVRARMFSSVGQQGDATRLFKVYAQMYSKPFPEELSSKSAMAEITRVADDADKTAEFTLSEARSVRVYAIGEGQGGQMFDYGWIENAETGKAVWEMRHGETAHAGGAGKNRKVDTVIELPAGKYRLRYKADDSHSYDNWNALPPDVNFWGIAVYAK
ncbi:MAG TPA: serine hydrolase domain-containing protein [Blastocatellia bacterium]|nr:serine hydrolase domain-containing protein [Blastocatellia bacterium]